MTAEVRIGCSGWVYKHWRGAFYPENLPQKHWFDFYSAEFDTVEINNSFYRLPSGDTFEKWCNQAPEGFCYAVKANRYLTQAKKLKDCAAPLERMMSAVRCYFNNDIHGHAIDDARNLKAILRQTRR